MNTTERQEALDEIQSDLYDAGAQAQQIVDEISNADCAEEVSDILANIQDAIASCELTLATLKDLKKKAAAIDK